jgi:hypothetical protein
MSVSSELKQAARCRCCGHSIKGSFRFCLGCYLKREKVYKDCIGAGKSEEWSRERVDSVYPEKFK